MTSGIPARTAPKRIVHIQVACHDIWLGKLGNQRLEVRAPECRIRKNVNEACHYKPIKHFCVDCSMLKLQGKCSKWLGACWEFLGEYCYTTRRMYGAFSILSEYHITIQEICLIGIYMCFLDTHYTWLISLQGLVNIVKIIKKTIEISFNNTLPSQYQVFKATVVWLFM